MSKKGKQPYFRFFASDWLGGTRGMKAAEVGVYITLIAMMYERCEPIPEDHKRLARQCGCSVSMLVSIIEMLVDDGKIARFDGCIWNDRVEKEFKWREKNSEQSSEAAHARWEKANKNNDDKMQTQSERNADGMPNQKPETRSHKEKDRSLESDFPDWYAAYPRHVGRGQAERAYATARKAADAETLISAARSFAEQSRNQDPKFIPHPATWLNGQRWLDVPEGDSVQIGENGGRDPATFSFDDWVNRVSVALSDGPWPEIYGPHPKTGKTQNVAALAKYYFGQFHKEQEKVA